LVALCRAGLATPAGIEKETPQDQTVRRGKPESLECATLVALCRAGLATPAGIEKETLQDQPVRRGKPRLQKAAASRRTPNFFLPRIEALPAHLETRKARRYCFPSAANP